MGSTPAPVSSNISSVPFSFSFSSMSVVAVIVCVFLALVMYHKTVGYYLDMGWNKMYERILGRQHVEVDLGDAGIVTPVLTPDPKDLPLGVPGAKEEQQLIQDTLDRVLPQGNEVFNVSRNIYTYGDASAVCTALGAELATYEQVKSAYDDGADWCNYGWVKGQMAVYPTQQKTWKKLQKGSPEYRNACGNPGINGGYFDNAELRFGVNCFGKRPPKNATDELLESQVALPPSAEEIEYNKKVQKFRDQLNTISVLPFNRSQWSD